MAEKRQIEGQYFTPMSSRADPAILAGSPGEVTLTIGAGSPVVVEIIEISDRLQGVPRKVTLSDGGVFEAAPDADLNAIIGKKSGMFDRLHRLETSWKAVTVVTVVCFALVVGFYRYGIPLLAAGAVKITPPVVVSVIDRGTLETVDQTLFEPSQLEQADRDRIATMFDELIVDAKLNSDRIRLLFRGGGKLGPNAVALPGGTVILTDELVNFSTSDDEIAGVLAHELGHVAHQHSLQLLYRLLGISMMITIVGADSSQFIDEVITQASALQTLAYTREFEAEADRYSVDRMVGLKRNPIAFVDLLDRVVKKFGGDQETNWLSTHPGNADRREISRARAAESGWQEP